MEINFDSQLVIGMGEVGKSLFRVLKYTYKNIDGYDKICLDDLYFDGENLHNQYDVLQICYPYSNKFIEYTKEYMEIYNPKLVIINSTVPVGTTEECGEICVNSPIRGRHPNLEEGIKTFIKFIGGNDKELVEKTIELFNNAGINCYRCQDSKTSELLKLICTTYYGWNIVFEKEVKKLCDKLNGSFHDIYNISNKTYNVGYVQLEEQQFMRPNLKHVEGEIGGHCVIPNCEILKDYLDWDIAKFILNKNKIYKNPKIEEVQQKAKELGHCCCDKDKKCPCDEWVNNNNCLCAK
jgi:UDP-glucose 6-dehydrogenase